MATFKTFEQIEAWKESRELTNQIYTLTGKGAFSEDYGLKDQIRRTCVSIMSNIAEGFERSGSGEFGQFLSMAKGSAGEVRSQLYIALDQAYLQKSEFDVVCGELPISGRNDQRTDDISPKLWNKGNEVQTIRANLKR